MNPKQPKERSRLFVEKEKEKPKKTSANDVKTHSSQDETLDDDSEEMLLLDLISPISFFKRP